VFLLDTNVISEFRKGARGNRGVQQFSEQINTKKYPVYLAAPTVGELRRGIEALNHRGDALQADILSRWLHQVLTEYAAGVIAFDEPCAQVWGRLMVPLVSNAIDKQVAATAIVHQLTLVTRNTRDFQNTGARLLNPFTEDK
jgi:toxin FitB